jgi:hypothetical protein
MKTNYIETDSLCQISDQHEASKPKEIKTTQIKFLNSGTQEDFEVMLCSVSIKLHENS